uniref:Uncharacterized protein n=1 Tax=Clastoptera arizonana TaxID=38151 RepID=A0A1B6CXP2_9HEMI
MVEVMEVKVKNELVTLTETLTRMQDEMIRLLDLEGLRSRAEERRVELTAERENLLETRVTVMTALDRAREKQQILERQLAESETHTQLSNLERKLAQLEQNNFIVKEFIATKTLESDYEPIRKTSLGLVKELNLSLRESLKKPL